jgi:hypothetical protein
MTASYHLITPLLAMAIAVTGFQLPSHRMFKYRSAATQSRLSLVRWQEDDGINSLTRATASVRPVLLSASTITTAAIIASTPILPSHAADSFDMSIISYSNNDGLAISDPESIRGSASFLHPDQYTTNTKSFTSLSSLQLSSSTLANPIGEIQDGSESGSIKNSFGQWFFVIYIVVSLLAGGKEMLSRIQKQIDKADT